MYDLVKAHYWQVQRQFVIFWILSRKHAFTYIHIYQVGAKTAQLYWNENIGQTIYIKWEYGHTVYKNTQNKIKQL